MFGLAENDNLTIDEFKAMKVPTSSAPEVRYDVTIITFGSHQGRFAALKHMLTPMFGRIVIPVAMQPHPQCPKWDGVTPRMSKRFNPPLKRERPAYLRVV